MVSALRSNLCRAQRGLTLIELVVVVAILGVLAAMLLPKFDGLQSAANHASTASSCNDLARLLIVTKTTKTVFPDGWDSLTDGTNLWTGTATTVAPGTPAGATTDAGGNAGTYVKGLHPELVAGISGGTSTAKLKLFSGLTAAQVTAFNTVGINTLLNVNTSLAATTTARPGDLFTVSAPLTTSSPIAVIDNTTPGGIKVVNHIYRANLRTGGTTGTTGALPANTQLVVFGCGPQNGLVPNSMLEAPTYANANAGYVYNRLLVVFEMTATKVTFKGVLGSDGDLMDDMSVNMQTFNN